MVSLLEGRKGKRKKENWGEKGGRKRGEKGEKKKDEMTLICHHKTCKVKLLLFFLYFALSLLFSPLLEETKSQKRNQIFLFFLLTFYSSIKVKKQSDYFPSSLPSVWASSQANTILTKLNQGALAP